MKIVVLDGYTLNPGDLSWAKLELLGDVKIYDRTPAEKILERSLEAEILFTNKTPLREEILFKLPSLRYIGVLATGYNIVDVDAAKKMRVVVTNVPSYGTYSVAQHTFALLLELCHHSQRHSDSVFMGKWANSDDFCYWDYPLIELAGKTIGIVGFGNIGEKVADIANTFGMQIVSYSKPNTNQSHRVNFRWVSINELFEVADVVTIHCPLTVETKGLVNLEMLKKMKNSSFFINTSRGPIVVEEDLAYALDNDLIAGAGIDVISAEPPSKDNTLLKTKNCIITPHIAWATKEARIRLLETAINNLKNYLIGLPCNAVVK